MARTSASRTSPRKKANRSNAPKNQVLATSSPKIAAQKVQRSQPAAADGSVSKARRPPCCSVCPGKPLRSQCSHTKVGREYILENELRQHISNLRPAMNPPGKNSLPQAASASSSTAMTQAPSTQAQTVARANHFQALNPNVVVSPPSIQPVLTVQPALSPEHANIRLGDSQSFNAQNLFTPLRENTMPSQAFVLNPIPPASNGYVGGSGLTFGEGGSSAANSAFESPSPTPSTPTPDSSTSQTYDPALSELRFTPEPDSSPMSQENPEPGSHISSPRTSGNNATKRVKPSALNPFHGSVQGVMRGPTQPYNILRSQGLPGPIIESKAALKRFRDGLNTIIRKCEELSAQTSCWLFVGAQHAAATGGAIHYASPRIRKDGGKETEALGTQFLQLIKTIAESRRVDTMELQKTLMKTKEDNEKLQDRLMELENQQNADRESRERDAQMIRDYEKRLGITHS